MDIMDYHELIPGATTCVEKFVSVTKEDKVLIITDEPMIAEVLAQVSNKNGAKVMVSYLPRVMRPMRQLSETLKSVILDSTVIFTPFDFEEGESSFREQILALAREGNGRKIVHMPSVTPHMFSGVGMLSLNPEEMQKMTELTEKLAILLSAAKRIKIQSAIREETNLSLDLGGWSRSGIVSTGHIRKGSWGNLPSGEAFVTPERGTASGKIVIDMAISGVPTSELPITLGVTNGIIDLDSIQNGKTLKDVLQKYPRYGDEVRTVGEFGIGTNPKPSFTLAPIEIEKILRTIHIAIGNNAGSGGDIESPVPHTDMVICRPTVEIDNLQSNGSVKIMEEGTIMEDRIKAFFKVRYTSLSEKLSDAALIRVIPEVRAEAKGDMLYRCWSDYRKHELCIPVGDEDTAEKVREVWSCIDPNREEEVGKILTKFNKKLGGGSMLVYQLLNTLEKFGIIKITKPPDKPRKL